MNTYERLVLRLLLAIAKMIAHGQGVGNDEEDALIKEADNFLTKTPKM